MWQKLRRLLAIIFLIIGFILLILSFFIPGLQGGAYAFLTLGLSWWQALALSIVFFGLAYLADSEFTAKVLGKFTEGVKKTVGKAGEIAREVIKETVKIADTAFTSVLSSPIVLIAIGVGLYFVFRDTGSDTEKVYIMNDHEAEGENVYENE